VGCINYAWGDHIGQGLPRTRMSFHQPHAWPAALGFDQLEGCGSARSLAPLGSAKVSAARNSSIRRGSRFSSHSGSLIPSGSTALRSGHRLLQETEQTPRLFSGGLKYAGVERLNRTVESNPLRQHLTRHGNTDPSGIGELLTQLIRFASLQVMPPHFQVKPESRKTEA